MDNFDLKKFVSEKTLLNESAPGYDTRKQGEALPTLESVKAAYEAKNDIKEESTEVFTDAELDMASEMLMDMYDKLGLRIDTTDVAKDRMLYLKLSKHFLKH